MGDESAGDRPLAALFLGAVVDHFLDFGAMACEIPGDDPAVLPDAVRQALIRDYTIACRTWRVRDPIEFSEGLASAWQSFACFVRLHRAPADRWEQHDLEAGGGQVVVRDMAQERWRALTQAWRAENAAIGAALREGYGAPPLSTWLARGILDLEWTPPGEAPAAGSYRPEWTTIPRPPSGSGLWWESFGWMTYRWQRAEAGRGEPADSIATLAGEVAASAPEFSSLPGYQCFFCGEPIAERNHDPVCLPMVSRWGQHRHLQRSQLFWCHEACLRRSAFSTAYFSIFGFD